MNTNEVFHLWAHQAKPEGKSGNVRFDGVDLYSYGAIIATMVNGVVVLSDRSYSMTTSRHQSKARQALTHEQMDKHIQVPVIPGSRNVAELAKLCKTAVENSIANMAGKRKGSKPMQQAFELAKRYERAGKFLGKWSLPDLPENLPEDTAPLIKAVSHAKLMAEYAEKHTEVKKRIVFLEEEAKSEYDPMNYGIQYYKARINVARQTLERMRVVYKLAKGKNPPLKTLFTRLAKAEAVLLPYAQRLQEEEAAKNLADAVKNVYENRNMTWLQTYSDKLGYVVNDLSKEQQPRYERLLKRVKERIAYKTATRLLAITRNSFNSELSITRLNAIRDALEAIKSPKFLQEHEAEIEAFKVREKQEREVQEAELKRKHAEDIASWLGGAKISLPYAAGTYARIVGNEVETSRGAKVPVEHAKTLARLYRITVRKGGMEWSDGTGPKVGFYQVNKIGADGTLVIGCHEFNPEEAGRLYELLTWEVEAA